MPGEERELVVDALYGAYTFRARGGVCDGVVEAEGERIFCFATSGCPDVPGASEADEVGVGVGHLVGPGEDVGDPGESLFLGGFWCGVHALSLSRVDC